MNQLSQQFIAALPSLLLISGMVTWITESIKPMVAKLNLSDTAYGIALRVIAAVIGVVIAGLLGSPNIFSGVVFYGGEINPLVGMLATAIIISAGANALHSIGEYLGTVRPATIISTPVANVETAVMSSHTPIVVPLAPQSESRSTQWRP